MSVVVQVVYVTILGDIWFLAFYIKYFKTPDISMKNLIFYTLLVFSQIVLSSCEPQPLPPDKVEPTRDGHLALGNPDMATADPSNMNHYLMEKPQYALSYNNSRGSANWVSWHLSTAWKGNTARQDDFRGDPDLPAGFFKASSGSYSGSGFDRGHLCPSDDRDFSVVDNSATFLMTNMFPQAPNLNRITWLGFEDFCRNEMNKGQELYIIAGGYGQGGEGSNSIANTIASGKIIVPSHCWKIAVILPVGNNDLGRIGSNTRVIAIDMPNNQTVNQTFWGDYRVSVDFIEMVTGFDFLSKVPIGIQDALEEKADTGPTF